MTNLPVRLRRDGSITIGWYFRVSGGWIEVGDRPAEDSILKVVDDFKIHLSLTRRRWDGDPEAITEAQKVRQRAVTTGKLRMEEDLSTAPPTVGKILNDLRDPAAALIA